MFSRKLVPFGSYSKFLDIGEDTLVVGRLLAGVAGFVFTFANTKSKFDLELLIGFLSAL